MELVCVTLTGADDTVRPEQLLALSQRYPLAEWAILFSQKRAGTPRYPSLHWVDELTALASERPAFRLAAHLCGKWVDDAMAGALTFLTNARRDCFRRVQLNMGKDRLRAAFTCEPLLRAVRSAARTVIFGGNYGGVNVGPDFFMDHGVLPLFDASGGRGIEAHEWPAPYRTPGGCALGPTGYAGGLGPDNVAAELDRIEAAAGDAYVWIDMESKLRSQQGGRDCFDLAKCEQVLQAVQAWCNT